jgi:phospholipid/cholesterol/gamma-HCH transport system substrate-binding protein
VKRFTLEAKVGLFLVAVMVLMGWISLRLGNFDFLSRGGYRVAATFETAAGLDPESKVLLAGLRVGRIESIAVVDGRARVVMRINRDVPLPVDSRIKINSQGLLGAKYLDIKPGTSAEVLKEGDAFREIDQPVELGALAADAQPIMANLGAITASLRQVIDSDAFRDRMTGITENVDASSARMAEILAENQANLARIVANLETMTRALADAVGKNEREIDRTLAALPQVAEGLADVAHRLAAVMEKNEGDLSATLAQLNAATAGLSKTMESASSIAQKIDEGKGTVGALINEPKTRDDLAEAVSGLNDLLGRAKRTKLDVDYNAQYLFDADYTKHYLSATLWPRPNQYYMIGLVSDEKGATDTITTQKETITNPGQPDETREVQTEKKRVTTDSFRFSAQIARRFWDVVLRGGLLESEGGAGVDYYVWDDHLKFTVEAFDFARETNPHVKGMVTGKFLNNFVVLGGVDDFISSDHAPYWFVGAGITITDDDVKSLISILPARSAF